MKKTTIIIGGGASGMLCASLLAADNNNVILVEKNEKLGKKLFLTGKGRCNITNACDISEFFDKIFRNKEFLYSSLYNFTNEDLLTFFKENGLDFVVERGNRVFPKSGKSSDVIKILNNKIREKVEIKLNEEVLEVQKKNNKFVCITNKDEYSSDNIVIATGGVSYPLTGSTGDGYMFAKNFEHTIKEIKPSLISMIFKDDYSVLNGVSLKNIEVSLIKNKKVILKEFGEIVFTKNGISGPCIFNLSSKFDGDFSNTSISIDLKPALSIEKLNNRILRDFEKYNNKNITNALEDLTIKSLIPVVLDKLKISSDKKTNQITKDERMNLVQIIKNFKFEIKELGNINESIITRGGISVDEINPQTMMSRKQTNLFFIGEIIDVDAVTGGFNLQIAFSTAAQCAEYLNKQEE